MDDCIYERLTETYLFDESTREWMMDENPHAMAEMMDRLFEAVERGMWDAKPETLERLKEIYLELEERIEEVNDRRRGPKIIGLLSQHRTRLFQYKDLLDESTN